MNVVKPISINICMYVYENVDNRKESFRTQQLTLDNLGNYESDKKHNNKNFTLSSYWYTQGDDPDFFQVDLKWSRHEIVHTSSKATKS